MEASDNKWLLRLLQEVHVLEQILPYLTDRSRKALRATNREFHEHLCTVTPSVRLEARDIELLLNSASKGRCLGITEFHLAGSILKSRHIAMLAACELRQLQHLDLSRRPLATIAIKQLVKGNWPSLTILNLAESLNGDLVASCQHLVASTWPALKTLNISHNSLSEEAFAELVKGNWTGLQQLDLNDNMCGYEQPFIAELAKASWTALQRLDLAWNKLSSNDVQALGQLSLPNLTKLNLNACLREVAAENVSQTMQFLSAGRWPELKDLVITHDRLRPESIAELLTGQWPRLVNLDLGFRQTPMWTLSTQQQAFPFIKEVAQAPWKALLDTRPSSRHACEDADWLRHIDPGAVVTLRVWAAGTYDHESVIVSFTVSSLPQLKLVGVSLTHMTTEAMQDLTKDACFEELIVGSSNLLGRCPRTPLWNHLGTLDLRHKPMCPYRLCTMLRSCAHTVNTLYVVCDVEGPTSCLPSHKDWPPETHLRMWADPKALSRLSSGYWPVRSLTVYFGGSNGSRYTRLSYTRSVQSLQALLSWDLPALQNLSLRGLDLGYYSINTEVAHMLSEGNWPNITSLDLSQNHVNADFVQSLVHGKWPLLAELDLSDNVLEESGMFKLSQGTGWPLLAELNVSRNVSYQPMLSSGCCFPQQLCKRVFCQCDARWPGIRLAFLENRSLARGAARDTEFEHGLRDVSSACWDSDVESFADSDEEAVNSPVEATPARHLDQILCAVEDKSR